MSGDWLAIDTATDTASVAVGQPPAATRVAFARGARRHAAEIVRLVDEVLHPLGLAPGDLEGIVVGDGPGSFTGLRIGWAAAKGLAHEAGLELRSIPSLMAAAAAAAAARGVADVPVAACFDALRGQVYGAVYVFRADRVDTLVAPRVATIEEFADPLPLDGLPPAAQTLLALLERPGAARVVDDPQTAEPVYGRPAEAQVRWEARHGRTLPHPSR